MLNETEAAASFHGLCHFFGRLSKASQAGMKAALRGCPKCHFPMLEGLAHTISTRGQDGACLLYTSDAADDQPQPAPAGTGRPCSARSGPGRPAQNTGTHHAGGLRRLRPV